MYDPGVLRGRMLQEIDSAISRNMSLPGHWYTDPEIFRFEQEFIIRRSWQPVGSAESLVKEGDYLTAVVADVPILIVRNDDGELRAFVNMCRHRGHPVAKGSGRRSSFTCIYHGWTYAADGRLLRAPRSEHETGFDAARYCLRPVRLGTWGPMAFVNPHADGPDFKDEFASLIRTAEDNNFGLSGMTYRKRLVWEQACNWKTFVDNTADCYHCRSVHPGMGKTHKTDPDEYFTQSFDTFAFHISRARPEQANVPDWMSGAVWPNWNIQAAPGRSARVRVVELLDVARIRVTTDFCAPPSISDQEIEEDAMWYERLVYGEDRPVCEAIAAGMAGGSFDEGPIFLASEDVMQDFQRKYRQRLVSISPAPPAG